MSSSKEVSVKHSQVPGGGVTKVSYSNFYQLNTGMSQANRGGDISMLAVIGGLVVTIITG